MRVTNAPPRVRAGALVDVCLTCPARRRGLCTAMGLAAFETLRRSGRRVTLAPDRALPATAPAGEVWVVRSGILRVQRLDPEGRRQIFALLFAGEAVLDDFLSRPGYSIEASVPSEICGLERSRFDALVRADPTLRRAVLRSRLQQLEMVRWLTWSLGALRTDERIAAFLLYGTRVLPFEPLRGGGGVLSVDLPRADIADLVATTPETLSRVTHRLQDQGILAILDPRRFAIPDLAALAQAAGLRDPDEIPQDDALPVG